MNMYRIEDGTAHWIFAESKRQAMKLWRNDCRDQGMEESDISEVAADGLSVKRCKLDDMFWYDDGNDRTERTVREWIALEGKEARYFACADY